MEKFKELLDFLDEQTRLSKIQKHSFVKNLVEKNIKKGECLIKKGEIEQFVYFVAKGGVRIYEISFDGKEVNLGFFFEKEFTSSYTSFLTREPSSAFIEALEDARIFCIPYEHMQTLYNDSKLAERLGRLNAEKLYLMLYERQVSLLRDTAQKRFMEILKSKPHWMQRISQNHLASFLGVTPETYSRIKRRVFEQKLFC